MITVTNGTVSRTYKVGDYEPRVVSLSFNIDPGSDVESLVADVVCMVERLARQTPKRRLTGDELVGEAHQVASVADLVKPDEANLGWVAQPAAKRKPRLDADPNDDLPPAMAAETEAAPTSASVFVGRVNPPTRPAAEASQSSAAPAPCAPPMAEPSAPPTADDVVKAAQAACNRLGVYGEHPERRIEVTAVVNKFVDTPNAPVRSTPEAKRAGLIAALAELSKSSDY